jgi:Beta-propeller repeat
MANKYQSVNFYRPLITALIFFTYVSIADELSTPSHLFAKQTSSNLASSPQFATYLGGSSVDDCDGISVDASGNLYLACHSNSKDFPGLKDRRDSDDIDAFVSKLDPRTGKLAYTTRLGGSGYDAAISVAVCNDGSVFVSGYTVSSDFHTTDDAIQRKLGGAGDIFLAKLNPDGSIEYSTYLGGSDQDVCRGMVVDSKEKIYLAGITLSENFPGVRGLDLRKSAAKGDAFIASLGLREQDSLRLALLGGSRLDEIRGIALDASGNLYVSGVTHSIEFPVKSSKQDKLKGNSDAFLAKLRISDLSLVYSILVGGSGEELGTGLAVDRRGNPYLTGSTTSADFPVSAKAFQRQYGGGKDAFVTKLDAAGTRFLYSTYIGGTGEDFAGFGGKVLDVDSQGDTWVVGQTKSRDFPIRAAIQTAYGGGDYDSFAIALDPSGSRLKFSSYYGGDAMEEVEGVTIAADGSVWTTGLTASHNIRTVNALQKNYNGGQFDALIVKIYPPILTSRRSKR